MGTKLTDAIMLDDKAATTVVQRISDYPITQRAWLVGSAFEALEQKLMTQGLTLQELSNIDTYATTNILRSITVDRTNPLYRCALDAWIFLEREKNGIGFKMLREPKNDNKNLEGQLL